MYIFDFIILILILIHLKTWNIFYYQVNLHLLMQKIIMLLSLVILLDINDDMIIMNIKMLYDLQIVIDPLVYLNFLISSFSL
jgi:hypothetical protein